MRIVGIDPGLNTTGYGVVECAGGALRLEEAGVVRSKARGTLSERIHAIHAGVADVLAALKPDVLAVERLYSHYDRPTTAILMGHARGVIYLAAAEVEVPVYDYAATQVKKLLTGNGRAPKAQMQRAIARELGLAEPPEPADVADALAIALCHYYMQKTSQLVNLALSKKTRSARNPI